MMRVSEMSVMKAFQLLQPIAGGVTAVGACVQAAASTKAVRYRVLRILLWFENLAVDYRTAQRQCVSIFKVVAEAKAPGEGGNACGKAGDLPVKIERCRRLR